MASFLLKRVSSKQYATAILQQSRSLKSALKIKWVRPEKIPFNDTKMTGDLAPLGTIDTTQFPTPWKASEELQSADEIVKRIHTLEFLPRQTLKQEYLINYTNAVKSHMLDDDSPEVKVAIITVKIRNLQIHMEKHRKDNINKVRLKEAIDKRNQMLSRLKYVDYKKFEWLLDRLDLQHKVFKKGGTERVERKKSLRRLTMLYIVKLKSERLQEYRDLLESQKEGFLKQKIEKLIWIKETEEECGAPATITDADIEDVRKQLQNLQVVKPKEIEE